MSEKRIIYYCPKCKEEIKPIRLTQKDKTCICKICGKEFKAKRSALYCSNACRVKAYQNKNRAEHNAKQRAYYKNNQEKERERQRIYRAKQKKAN